MPLYEYSCSQCAAHFEKLLKIVDRNLPVDQSCPECKSPGTVSMAISAANFGDPISLGIKRPDAGWGEVLAKVKQAHPRHKMGERFTPTRTM
jgi:putative FmdB family regulatory protein